MFVFYSSASTSISGIREEAVGAEYAAASGAAATESDPADASSSDCRQEKDVCATSAAGNPTATDYSAIADHTEAVSTAAGAEFTGARTLVRKSIR